MGKRTRELGEGGFSAARGFPALRALMTWRGRAGAWWKLEGGWWQSSGSGDDAKCGEDFSFLK